MNNQKWENGFRGGQISFWAPDFSGMHFICAPDWALKKMVAESYSAFPIETLLFITLLSLIVWGRKEGGGVEGRRRGEGEQISSIGKKTLKFI